MFCEGTLLISAMEYRIGSSGVTMKKPTLCPSGRCKEGAILFGVIQRNGQVAFLGDEIKIDQTFVERANEGRAPEKRFRFGNNCARNACGHWTEDRCSVIDQVLLANEARVDSSSPAVCPLRLHCRWFKQTGLRACSICPLVITDPSP